ncbi:glycine receptor subunit alpha-2-like isoform X1 [Lineus longissimus]|uniref:glycine receptor subunit alpha-2-like isoform X1 n=1 Tax=Lineus longissimus TaxID=88925 RepID=UPI002B4DE36F
MVAGMKYLLVALISLFSFGDVSGKIPDKFNKTFFTDDYDNTIRPGANEDNATNVSVFFHVNTIGSISGISMDFLLDIYFHQRWLDERLSFNGTKRVTLAETTHRRFWWPDTFFYNAKGGHQHDITTTNEFVHILPDGTVKTSQRFSLLLNCFMDLHNFPMDSQECSLIIGSYGYVDDEIHYSFVPGKPTTFNDDVMLPEFRIDEVVTESYSKTMSSSGNYSMLTFTFHLERDFGYYLIQTYIPSIMIVILSWVNFWLDVHATPARVSLGLLTVLTMSTQISGINAQLPRVSYVKAIDVWMSTCLSYVVAALLEFAVVNVVTRRDELKMRNLEKRRKAEAEVAAAKKREANLTGKNDDGGEGKGIDETTTKKQRLDGLVLRLLQQNREVLKIRNARKVEKTCRLAFPVSFCCFIVFYWLHYWCKWFTHKYKCKP